LDWVADTCGVAFGLTTSWLAAAEGTAAKELEAAELEATA
jgi:hypothetical protein